MSYARFTDYSVLCDHAGAMGERCHVLIWGTEMGLGDGMTVREVRRWAADRGWKSRRVELGDEGGCRRHAVTQDFCPACATNALAGDPEAAAKEETRENALRGSGRSRAVWSRAHSL